MFAYRELLIELVGQQGVWQLSEVELTQRAHTVDVLDVNVFGQVRDLLRVELVPEETGRGQIQSSACKFDRMSAKAPSNSSLLTFILHCIFRNSPLFKGPINANMCFHAN